MAVLLLSFCTGGMTILSQWLLMKKSRWGWVVSLSNQVPWLVLIALTEAWGLIPLNLFISCIAIRGLRTWRT